ncbi:LPXTG-domain-containing protein cell wall anchor domain [Gemella sanguinis M325]|uniref:LPXTG cell wall anchor domain-containing protein n=1 Tax=Gemella sanguinis TaxID=84135 RepID=UPI0002E2AB00|nr:LPXTG cell wall anchor domain-containing protein [Gemella sanguinis]EPC06415.1 LPXTG-domain-containing protein cell wall anchor domain [Gemella sanguinis M325]
MTPEKSGEKTANPEKHNVEADNNKVATKIRKSGEKILSNTGMEAQSATSLGFGLLSLLSFGLLRKRKEDNK